MYNINVKTFFNPRPVIWQTVYTQMKCSSMLHFIRVCTVCYNAAFHQGLHCLLYFTLKTTSRDRNTSLMGYSKHIDTIRMGLLILYFNSGIGGQQFYLRIHLFPYFLCASSEGSAKSVYCTGSSEASHLAYAFRTKISRVSSYKCNGPEVIKLFHAHLN